MLVNTFIVGAGKSGTSWINSCFIEHPDIFVSYVKENNFFSSHYEKGIDFYKKNFLNVANEKIIADVSPQYMYHEKVAERIHNYNSKAKILFVLRNPIDRAFSHFKMERRYGNLSSNITYEILNNKTSLSKQILEMGMYGKHILRYQNLFPSNQIHYFYYDDLKKNPKKFLKEIFSTLSVDKTFIPSIINTTYHVTRNRPRNILMYRLSVYVYNNLFLLLKNIRAEFILEYLRKNGFFNFIQQLNTSNKVEKLTDHDRKQIAHYYKNDIENYK